MAKTITFIIGGARSGKSRFALQEAAGQAGKKAFFATASACDDEMACRIERHKQDRGTGWDTYEEPLATAELLQTCGNDYRVILIDCLTLWLTGVMLEGRDTEAETEKLIASLRGVTAEQVYIVANEVGAGIVPDNELARRFRDLAGTLNQQIAALADEVYLMAAGIPVRIKGGSK